MKFMSKDMKEVLTIIKRLVKDKKTGKIMIQSKGDMRINIKAMSDDGKCMSYHTIASLNDEVYSFTLNPYPLDELLTRIENTIKKQVKELKEQAAKNGEDKKETRERESALRKKLEEVEFKVNNKSITFVGGKDNFKTKESQEDIQFYFEELKDAKAPVSFIELLKGADTAMKKNKDVNSSYLKITSEKALAAEERQIHLYRVEEELPFTGGYIHKDFVSFLSKSIKGEFKLGMKDDFLVILNKDHYYLVKIEKNIQFPSFRNMTPLKREIAFIVNADEVNNLLKEYKKPVSEILFSVHENRLVFDPRVEEAPVLELPVKVSEGGLKKALFELDTIKSLFSGYQGEVSIEQQQFRNVYGVVGYLWRIYTPEKLTMISGIEEPDWEKIEKYYQAGKIKELIQEKKQEIL